MSWKFVIGLALALLIGAGCRLLGIPAPAPPALVGALLVLAMTAGYLAADRWLARRAATTHAQCGGPSGRAPSETPR
jgi:XapX domain-containing protein